MTAEGGQRSHRQTLSAFRQALEGFANAKRCRTALAVEAKSADEASARRCTADRERGS